MPIDFKKFEDRVDPQFWTNSNRAPKAQFRFRVVVPGLGLEDARNEQGEAPGGDVFEDKQNVGLLGSNAWYVKSCDKPGMDLPDDEQNQNVTGFQRARANPRVTTPTMRPITMVLIDPYYPNVTRKVARLFRRGGLMDRQARNAIQPGGDISDYARSFLDSIGDVQIYQLDEKGNDIERWTLHDAYPDQVDFGKFDYSSNDLVEITLTWYYSAFTVEFPNIGAEQDFKYFKDAENFGSDIVEEKITRETLASKCAKQYAAYKKKTEGKGRTPMSENEYYLTKRSCKDLALQETPTATDETDDELTGEQ